MTGTRDVPPWLGRWQLSADGEPIRTDSSLLLPVLAPDGPAMLKIARIDEERRGHGLMRHWAGCGAAEVLAADGPALLMRRAMGPRDLVRMVRQGQDTAATEILISTAKRLHACPADGAPADLVPLSDWFGPLKDLQGLDDRLHRAWSVAEPLLRSGRPPVPLHGDVHHGNVLDFGGHEAADWRAIDPKGLIGDPVFDVLNLFCNPDQETAVRNLEPRLDLVGRAVDIAPRLLLGWLFAWCGLSAAFFHLDGLDPDPAFQMLEAVQRLAG